MPYDTIFNPLKQRTPQCLNEVRDKDKPFYSDCNQGSRFLYVFRGCASPCYDTYPLVPCMAGGLAE